MKSFRAIFPIVCSWATLAWAQAAAPPGGAALVAVQLASGRVFAGAVDQRTTASELVLRGEKNHAFLLRSITWDRITAAHDDSGAIPFAEIKSRLTGLKSATPSPDFAHESWHPAADLPSLPAVESITADAFLANWDADLETDGLALFLQPLASDGSPLQATGTVEVELYAVQYRDFNSSPSAGGKSVERVGRWVQPISQASYSSRGAALRLAFQAVHPEFSTDRGVYGLVYVRLTIPGSGIFERTLDGVRIRPWAPIRDELELTSGFRFTPQEITGRGRNWVSQP